ncbi:MAG: transposase [Thalassobaculum sp.]
MRSRKLTQEQIIAILKDQETGAKTAEVCRSPGNSDAPFFEWKARYGGREVSEAHCWEPARPTDPSEPCDSKALSCQSAS